MDFINLDNATPDQFDFQANDLVRKNFAARHRQPANSHRSSSPCTKPCPTAFPRITPWINSSTGIDSGRRVYADLLKAQNDAHKRVYVLASHSHYFMDGIFNTRYWREHGGVLPGWIVGTAGAVRYALPPEKVDAKAAATNVYGFLLGTVQPSRRNQFRFSSAERIRRARPPSSTTYKPEFVHWCFAENSVATLARSQKFKEPLS